jgi:hypothetical protein
VAGEYLLEFRDRFLDLLRIFVVQDDRECEFPKILSVIADGFQALAQFFYRRLF